MTGTGSEQDHGSLGLYEGLREAGMSWDDLWAAYLSLDGAASELELEAYSLGVLEPDAHTHNVIAQAINERFLEVGGDHPVAYRDLDETAHPG